MLIEFSVSNFRSFRDKQTLSMVAAPRLQKKENVFKPEVTGEKLPDLLKVAAVYGPNASGKSNLILALGIFSGITAASNSEHLPISSFRFDPVLQDKPSEFEWNFVTDGIRYQYILAATEQRIWREELYVFPYGKETLLYQRKFDGVSENYQFGATLEGGDLVHQAWQNLTGPRTLFIVQAVANSSENLKQLRAPFEWLDWNRAVRNGMTPALQQTLKLIEERAEIAEGVARFLQEIDVPITQIEFLKDSSLSAERKIRLMHQTALGSAQFRLSEESEGTRNLIGFWVLWVSLNARPQFDLRLLAIDELDSSLHPNIIIALLKKRLELEHSNQMIFTTHDTHLMDAKILRRDQFWITERDANGATQLRSIHDFAGRESEDIEKRYYEGRYRGLPLLRKR
ncbi:MAG: ATP-binding protein [Burkholderiales bacterium]|nr:ATP-binding protein [Burkholderiales bacterium]